MSAAAASARAAFLLSRFRDLSMRCHPPSSLAPGYSTAVPRRAATEHRLSPRPAVCCCLASGVDGGGLADEFVSTAREERRRRREYSALANVLCGVEPLDSSMIGAGVSAAAKDAMKRTISSMLGLLPSDQFHVAVGVSRQPLLRLLVSSVITGYTLWNAEYRLSLMRNFDSSPASPEACLDSENSVPCDVEGRVDRDESVHEMAIPESFEALSPDALSYIQKLEAEVANTQKTMGRVLERSMEAVIKHSFEEIVNILAFMNFFAYDGPRLGTGASPSAELDKALQEQYGLRCLVALTVESISFHSSVAKTKELTAQYLENRQLGSSKGDESDLLEYLRSLEPAMVTELSQPSSLEVEEIIQQLVQNIHLKCFKDATAEFLMDADGGKSNFHKNFVEDNTQQSDILNTTRDYLARLLFWCMLLGHHMRGLEYRLHLSFAVGL